MRMGEISGEEWTWRVAGLGIKVKQSIVRLWVGLHSEATGRKV